MKRRFLSLAVILTMVLTLCITAIPALSESGDTTVTFWSHQRHDREFIEGLLEKFNAEDNGIKVDFQVYTDNFGDMLAIAYQSGQAPDLQTGLPTGMTLNDAVKAGIIRSIDDLVSPEVRAANEAYFVETINMVDGKLYTLPHVGHDFRLAVNLDAFEAAGVDPDGIKSYQDLIDAAKKITEWGETQEPKVYGFMLPTGEWNWIWDGQYVGALTRYNGEWVYDFKTGAMNFEAVRKPMEMYLQMKADGSLFPGGVEMLNDPARQQFSEGTVGMILAASWDVGVFNDQFPAKINWKCVNLPTYDGEYHGQGNFSGGGYLTMNANAKNPEAAMKWFEYLINDENLEGYYSGGYGLPVRSEIAMNAKVQPSKTGFKDFANTEIDSIYPPTFPFPAPEPNWGNYMNQIMLGDITIDQAIEKCNMLYNAAIAEEIDMGGDLTPYVYPNFDFADPVGSAK